MGLGRLVLLSGRRQLARASHQKQLNVISPHCSGSLAAAMWATWAFFSGTSWANQAEHSLTLDTRGRPKLFFAAMLLIPLSLSIGMFRQTRSRLLKIVIGYHRPGRLSNLPNHVAWRAGGLDAVGRVYAIVSG